MKEIVCKYQEGYQGKGQEIVHGEEALVSACFCCIALLADFTLYLQSNISNIY